MSSRAPLYKYLAIAEFQLCIQVLYDLRQDIDP